jgi:methionine aminotransferase
MHTGLTPIPSYGSYFQLYSYHGLSEKNEFDFAKQLVVEGGVATIPVSAFYKKPIENQVLRFCFAKKESTLQQASERLTTFFQKLKN